MKAAISCVVLLASLFSCSQKAYDFRFFAIGDMPYHLPEDIQRFERLTDALNEEEPSFTVHVGDIKAGNTPCSDEYFMQIQDLFWRFEHPLVYTPGDNEWTDCHREGAGGYDPNERLDKVRQVFYGTGKGSGSVPISLVSQNSHSGFEKFVENALWDHQGVTFATFHVVGSNNNLKNPAQNPGEKEHGERDAANIYWLEEVFKQAKANESQGLVLFLHASLKYNDDVDNGFRGFTQKLRQEVLNYAKPVLMVYGDHHRFLMEKPLVDDNKKVLKHFTTVMVFGDHDIHAVEVRINKKDELLFEVRQFFGNYEL